MNYADLQSTIWSGLRTLPTLESSQLGSPSAEDHYVGKWLGETFSTRVAIWTPMGAGTEWSCPLFMESASPETVSIAGDGAVTALCNALRIWWPHLLRMVGAGVHPARWDGPAPAWVFDADSPPTIDDALPFAQQSLLVAGQLESVAISHPVPSAEGAWFCWLRIGDRVITYCRGAGPIEVLAYAARELYRLRLDLHLTTDDELPSALPGGDHTTAILWSGLMALPSVGAGEVGPPLGTEVRCEVVDGNPVIVETALWRPRLDASGWHCATFVNCRMPDPILIPGAGPVSALINAHDVLRLLDDEWLGEVHFPDADSDDSGSTELPILDDASVGTLAEEILRFGAIERRVALGPVRRVKQDNFTAWLCALSIEGIENQRMIQGHDQLAAIQMALMLLLSHIHKGGALSKRKPTHDAQFDSESES